MKKTIENLAKAFVGESQARNRYSFYAKTAMKEGYEQIAEIFMVTADNEKQHAKWFFRMIQELKGDNSEIMVEGGVPTVFGTTIENLKAAIAGEHHEHKEMYPEFADIAEKESLPEVARRIRAIAKSEEHHEERFKKLLSEVEEGTVFKKAESKKWICRECGYEHHGKEAPDSCPSCSHPQSFFQIKCETY
jgi:rubrerythrin